MFQIPVLLERLCKERLKEDLRTADQQRLLHDGHIDNSRSGKGTAPDWEK